MKTLSEPSERQLLHKRTVKCFGYKRTDGLFDIEGYLKDVKNYPLSNFDRGPMKAGDPVHEMWLRLTVDLNLEIKKSEAVIVWGPYHMCGRITPNFKRLEGQTIKAGFRRRIQSLVGGTQGCTHLVELLGPIATTAFQTIYPEKNKKSKLSGHKKKPQLIDSCHAWASDSEMVAQRHKDFFTGEEKKIDR
tara:strand:- start:94 stop:663 length:570 start_codon:yes stop_codon:yes gene_type:complete